MYREIERSRRPRWRRWAGWGVAVAFYMFDLLLRLAPNVVTSRLQHDFDLGAAAVSAAFGSSFFYAYAAVQFPVGWLLDRLGASRTIALASLLAGGGALLFASARTVAVGTVARVLSGAGCGAGWLGAVKMIRNSFGARSKLAKVVFGVTTGLGGVGGLASQAPFAALVRGLGWRGAFRAVAAIPACIAVLALLVVDDDPADEEDDNDDDDADGDQGEEEEEEQEKTTLWTVVRTPRMWLYAGYLGGTDAPFETFAGLWGIPYLKQAVGWAKSKAAAATTALVVVATLAQLAGGPLLAHRTWLGTYRRRMAALVLFAAAGAAGFVPSLLARAGPAAAGGGAGALVALLGLSVGSCTVVWHCASSDPLCRGARGTGLVAGALNTVIIAIDAVSQTAVGAALGADWAGKKNPATGDPVYSPAAYAKAFSILVATFVMAILCAMRLWWTNGDGVGDHEEDHDAAVGAPPPAEQPPPATLYGSIGNGGGTEHPELLAKLKERSNSRDLSNFGASFMEHAREARRSTGAMANVDDDEGEGRHEEEQIDYAALIDSSDDDA